MKTKPTFHAVKRVPGKLLILRFAVACNLAASSISSAQSTTPFFAFKDTFEDAINDDQPITWKSRSNYFPCTTSVEDGSLILSKPQDSPYYYNNDRYSLGLLQAQMDSKLVLGGDISIRAVVRVSDRLAYATLWTRGGKNPPFSWPGFDPYYYMTVLGSGRLEAGHFGSASSKDSARNWIRSTTTSRSNSTPMGASSP